MFTINFNYAMYDFRQYISIIKQYFILWNLWSKEVPVKISYISNINKIDGYLYAMIIPTSVRYIITNNKQINYKKKKINKKISRGNG